MRSHAKAPSAGSNLRQTQGLGRIVVVLSFALLTALVFAASAQAGGRVVSSSFGSAGGGAGQFSNVTDVAVNDEGKGGVEPGAVYTVESNNRRIQQFTPTGSFVRAFGWDVVESGQDNSGGNEQQKLTLKAPSGGKFRLKFGGAGTGAENTKGTWSSGSKVVTLSGTQTGTFAVGQVFNASTGSAGIPEGDEIESCSPTCASATSLTLTQQTTAAGTNKPVRGYDIPYNATAAEVETRLNGLSTIGGVGGSVTVSRNEVSPTEFEYTITFGGTLGSNDVAALSEFTTQGLAGVGKSAAVTTPVPGGGFEICKTGASPADVCKAGSALPGAGAMSEPQGIAVDPANGNLYVTDQGNRRVDVFSATGAFEGAFGWGVKAGDVTPFSLDFCTTVTGCQAGQSGAGVGEFGATLGHLAIDTSVTPHRLYVASPGNLRIDYFAPTLTGNTVTGVGFVKTLGWDVVSSGPDNTGTGLELCNPTANPTDVCKTGISKEVGFYNVSGSVLPLSIAVDKAGSVFAAIQSRAAASLKKEAPTRVLKFSFSPGPPETVSSTDFAPASLFSESGSASSFTNYNVAIDPETGAAMVAKKAGTETTMKFLEFDENGNELSVSPPSSLTVSNENLPRGLAYGTEERLYYADGNGNKVYVLTPPPPPTVSISAANNVTTTTAVLHGKVTPPPPGTEGEHFATSYNFEYSADGVTWQSTPTLQAGDGSGSIEVSSSCPIGNPQSCNVSQEVGGLQSNKGYLVRLRVSTGSVATSSTTSFTTNAAPPTVTNPFSAEAATQTSAKILGVVNPNNQATTYHFEWGETTSYGSEAPPLEAFAGSGGEGVRIAATLSGLTPATIYHFRLVATSPAGTTVGPDRQFETLDHCGLPDDRCYELVSPPDKGPAGVVTTLFSSVGFQASLSGDAVKYPMLASEGATTGGGLGYLGKRSETGWSSSQLNPPTLVQGPKLVYGGTLLNGSVPFASPELTCSVLTSFNPLTEDVPAVDREQNLVNLFRRNADGTFDLITSPVPRNSEFQPSDLQTSHTVYGGSSDCDRVYFSSLYEYLPSPTGLYEWDDGTIRDAGLRPDGSMPAGQPTVNAVSDDGKLYFSTTSNEGGDSGKAAVFMRKDGGPSVDVTLKQGGANDSLGSRFGKASEDGSHVYFVSTYGLTSSSSAGTAEACNSLSAGEVKACDLYDYETGNGHLTDLTADSNPADTKGAVVQRVLAASEEGGAVYFSAMGQLVPGKGKTYAQNTEAANASERTANIYLAKGGSLEFVTNGRDGLVSEAKTTPDGSYLLFRSSANLTGSEAGGHSQAYLYSSASGEIQCVSCRRDGQTAVGLSGSQFAGADGTVFFSSRDALAPGAAQGNINVYEWKRGQTFLLVAGQGKETSTAKEVLYGASSSGDDVFFGTILKLDPHDVDTVTDLYDARAGGGFAPPPTPPTPCDPFADQCQGAPATPPSAPNPVSGAAGSGNPPIGTQKPKPKPRCGKNRVRRKGRCVRPRKHKRSPAHKRAANANRGGIK